MRIAVFGTGGAGGYFGARLAQAGEDDIFIARGPHLDAIRERGLHVEAPSGDFVVRPTLATDDATEVGNVDVVLVGVKAWQVSEAAEDMRAMLGATTMVVPLQNGVEAPTQLASVLGKNHVIGGLCATLGLWSALARFAPLGRAISSNSASYMRARVSAPTCFSRFLSRRASRPSPDDIRVALWEKFLFVASWGGVGAVTRVPIGTLRALTETRQLLEQGMRETLAVAQAHKVSLSSDLVGRTLSFMDSLAPNGTTSLQRDIAEGKPSELEAWNGANNFCKEKHQALN